VLGFNAAVFRHGLLFVSPEHLAEAKGPEITRKLCEKPVEGASLFTDLALIEGCSRNDIGQLMA
jgi:hypothetical protein